MTKANFNMDTNKDDCVGIHPDNIAENYSVDGTPIHCKAHQTGAGHDLDEEDNSNAELWYGIQDDNNDSECRNSLPAMVAEDGDHTIYEAGVFIDALHELRALNHVPASYGILQDEWEDGQYLVVETIFTGQNRTKMFNIPLPDRIWQPQVELWAQGLVLMDKLLAQSLVYSPFLPSFPIMLQNLKKKKSKFGATLPTGLKKKTHSYTLHKLSGHHCHGLPKLVPTSMSNDSDQDKNDPEDQTHDNIDSFDSSNNEDEDSDNMGFVAGPVMHTLRECNGKPHQDLVNNLVQSMPMFSSSAGPSSSAVSAAQAETKQGLKGKQPAVKAAGQHRIQNHSRRSKGKQKAPSHNVFGIKTLIFVPDGVVKANATHSNKHNIISPHLMITSNKWRKTPGGVTLQTLHDRGLTFSNDSPDGFVFCKDMSKAEFINALQAYLPAHCMEDSLSDGGELVVTPWRTNFDGNTIFVHSRNCCNCFSNSMLVIGPINWAGLKPEYCECALRCNQSPINFNQSISFATEIPHINIPLTSWAKIQNIGSTVQVFIDGMTTFSGKTYHLIQYHFHTPSEHRIENEYYPLEMHMVHEADDGEHIVIGVLFQLSNFGHTTNFVHQTIVNINDIREPRTQSITGYLDFSILAKAFQITPIYQYTGSLTMPPCTEGVTFLTLVHPMALDVISYNKLKYVMKFNVRTILVKKTCYKFPHERYLNFNSRIGIWV
ncbi:hypothetical protein D9758_017178 [Tetrapyrgos nigripes]|uniref:Carbonic anhydrase n=1 Tax=Tetrapyrgos nigripes TaxID=182062 RepID=A0A8H5C2H4_9AGAR|nr:hypothetical protein D9758_017178 [Tetrapyrgos nigripes]